MKAWRIVGFGLGIAASACLVEFEDNPPVYEVDTGTASDSGGTKSSGNETSSNSSSSNETSSSNSSNSSSSNGSGGDGGGANSSSASNSGTGGGSSSTGGAGGSASSGGSPATNSGGTGGNPTTTSTGGTGGTPGAIDDCAGDDPCSACNAVFCAYYPLCCSEVSFFAAQAYPEWVEMPELVTSYSENESVELVTDFTGDNQVAAVAFHFAYYMYLSYGVSIDATVTGGFTMTVSLEDSATMSGCVYTTGTSLDAFDIPDNCWGDYDGYLLYPADFPFNQINVRLETLSSGSGQGSLVINTLAIQ